MSRFPSTTNIMNSITITTTTPKSNPITFPGARRGTDFSCMRVSACWEPRLSAYFGNCNRLLNGTLSCDPLLLHGLDFIHHGHVLGLRKHFPAMLGKSGFVEQFAVNAVRLARV